MQIWNLYSLLVHFVNIDKHLIGENESFTALIITIQYTDNYSIPFPL